MEDSLAKRGHSLEEMFFMQRNAELIEQQKKLEQMKTNRDALAQVSGIRDHKVLDKLVECGVSPGTLASLAILPLVEVAWADGKLDEKEKKAILAGAAGGGVTKGSIDYVLLDAWLKQRPSPDFLEAWVHYISGLREVMGRQELDDLKSQLLDRARKVAEAAGGVLGLISRISPEEQAVLKKMEDAFIR